MKLIIDIPKERLDSIKHFGIKQNEVSMLERALISGTPLPKEHGRLIDADVLVDGMEELKLIRDFIVENIAQNPDVFIKCLDIDVTTQLDVIDIIVGLYDMLHKVVTGENYDYMWHWANKIGFWCDDEKFYNLIVKAESEEE